MLTSQLKVGTWAMKRSFSTSCSSVSQVSFQLQMSSHDHRRFGTAGPLAADEEGQGRFESSVNAVPFGLVATGVLIAIFLLIAFFERFMFVKPTPSPPLDQKFPPFASPKMDVCKREISVLMPGEDVPTFIAQPCPPSSSSSSF
ncbi:hypothetical protein AtNW77_Chr4g0306031 [Arabidopsis thaliana]|uniref:Transmembrane protein n=2 Tax=Arabidopsis TaxID=3701 RepID=F4JKI8_ARATH|nr:uncharacterized protein AT4G28170 [Arabidopsis thaliana]AEE85448.1 transmembrane protein [Arabidopsis thaliana]KAG7622091.1 hypothetical protein ISN44_As04g029210 [Arabidopsis suecica]|eukprot:NP_194546.2 transmembrane protein [Arabidopsis thaliana]